MKQLLVLSLFAVTAAVAQQPAPEPPSLPPAAPLQIAPRAGITSEAQLSLPYVIQAVLANNRDVEVSRLSQQKAYLNIGAAEGYFDPVIGGTAYKLRQVSPQASSLGGAINGAVAQDELFADPQISGNSPYLGTNYSLDFLSAKINNNNSFNALNPVYATGATLNLTQPLWRGLLFDQNRERLFVARKGVVQTDQQFRQRVIDVTTQAIRAYWELEYALRNLDVQIEAVRLAEQQDASNRRQVEQGTEAVVDVIQTQTQMSNYQQSVFNAQQTLTQSENTLKLLMLPNRNDPLWNAALKTVVTPDDSGPIPTLQEALRQALAERPDLKAGEIGEQISELDARLAKEQTKPQINLIAQVGVQGLAGQVVPSTGGGFGAIFLPILNQINELSTLAGIPPISTTSFGSTSSVPDFFVGANGQSLQTLRDGRFPTVKIGVQVSLPIGNRTARAEAAIATVNQKQTITQQLALEMTVESDVRNTLQKLMNSDLILNTARRAAQLAQQQYDSEQRQFKAGTSSVFLVLQRQNELIAAKLREIRAVADRGEAQADFDRATANTLHRQNIDLTN